MAFSIQKASFWKRISAYIFDFILSIILTLGIAFGMTAILQYDEKLDRLEAYRAQYEQEYGIDLDITQEDYEKFTSEEKAEYDAIYKQVNDAINKDKAVMKTYSSLITLTLVTVTVSLLVSTLFFYFVVPLLFKNGQTLGKKIFGLAVMRTNGVKISNPVLFIRSILGLYAIETMFPMFLIAMILVGWLGMVGTVTLMLFFILQLVVLGMTSATRSSIHDLMSDTVVVDMASQKIFNSNEELLAYQKAEAAEKAAAKPY